MLERETVYHVLRADVDDRRAIVHDVKLAFGKDVVAAGGIVRVDAERIVAAHVTRIGATEFAIGSFALEAQGMLGWRHTFGDVTPGAIVSFAGGNAFTVEGAPIARDAAVIEAGVRANISGRAAVGLTYGGQFSGRETDNGLTGTLAVSF